MLLLVTPCLQAGVSMLGTRIVYPEASKGVNVELRNLGEATFIVQSWVSQFSDDQTSADKVPFVVTPPIAKLVGNQKQKFKISFTHQQILPQDRESIFYFNFLEVPYSEAVMDNSDGNKLQLTVRHQLKLFYRPEAVQKQTRKIARDAVLQTIRNGKNLILRYSNNSPYYLSMSGEAKLQIAERDYFAESTMLAPYSTHDFVFSDIEPSTSTDTAQLSIYLINDFGASLEEHYDVDL